MGGLTEFFQVVLGVGIGAIAVWLLTDDDRPDAVVDRKTLDINGSNVTVETMADGRSRVVAFHDQDSPCEPATRENGRLADFWEDMVL